MKQSDDLPDDFNSEKIQLNRKQIGERLREARDYINLSQEDVATHIGIPRSALSQIESGQRRIDVLELKQLAELYKRPIAYFTKEELTPSDSYRQFTYLARSVSRLSDNDREELRLFAEYLHARAKTKNPADG